MTDAGTEAPADGANDAADRAGVAAVLDHAGVCTRNGPALWAAFEALGFALTPVARQSAGPDRPLGTANRCAMLRGGYLELLAVLDPALPDNGLGRLLDRHEGMHILALGIDDPDANLRRLRRAGLEVAGVSPLERPVDDPDGPRARFRRIPLPEAPEGRVQLIRHDTPDLLWQPRWLDHPNNAAALVATVLVSADAAGSAARLSRLAGLPLEPDPAGGFAMPIGEGRVRILPPDSLPLLLPGVEPPSLPFHAGIVVRTADRNAAARRLLAGVAQEGPLGLTVPPAHAGGVALVFAD